MNGEQWFRKPLTAPLRWLSYLETSSNTVKARLFRRWIIVHDTQQCLYRLRKLSRRYRFSNIVMEINQLLNIFIAPRPDSLPAQTKITQDVIINSLSFQDYVDASKWFVKIYEGLQHRTSRIQLMEQSHYSYIQEFLKEVESGNAILDDS